MLNRGKPEQKRARTTEDTTTEDERPDHGATVSHAGDRRQAWAAAWRASAAGFRLAVGC
jgi:hypothetical protein